jgi:RNA polymerase sigma-54 factor
MRDGIAAGSAGRAFELTQMPALVLTVTPAMIQYAELIAMGMDEVEGLVATELAQNPALELTDVPGCATCGRALVRSFCPACAASGFDRGRSPESPGDAFEPVADEPASVLADVLVELAPGDRRIAEYVIGNLTPRGLLDVPLELIARDVGVGPADVALVVERLRDAAGPGFAASSLEEFLLRQLDGVEDCAPDEVDLCKRVIEHHLEDLARGDVAGVARALETSTARVLHARALIRRRLRPPAGIDVHRRPTVYASPDVVVTLDAGGVTVEVVERHRFPLAVGDPFRTGSAGEGRAPQGLGELAARARSFIERLEGRWRTLQRIAEATVLFQEDFVRHGPARLRPLTRAQIARVEGLHESTVSRATKDKFVLLPSRELVPFGRFFQASAAPKEALRTILAGSERPRSDGQLAGALAELGFPVARRTVAKYRRELGFPARRAN